VAHGPAEPARPARPGGYGARVSDLFDPAAPAFLADPYPAFAELRRRGPVHSHAGLGLHVVVGHSEPSTVAS
jgi:cytochrome P450